MPKVYNRKTIKPTETIIKKKNKLPPDWDKWSDMKKMDYDYKQDIANEKGLKNAIRTKGYSYTKLNKYIEKETGKYKPVIKHIKNLSYAKRNIISIRFNENQFENRTFTIDKIKKISEKLSNYLKDKDIKGKMATAMNYGDLNWKSGYFREIGQDVILYDPNRLYNLEVEYEKPDHINAFNIYIALGEKNLVGGTNNIHNDCLYDCLEYYIFNIKDYFKHPAELKKYLGLKRDDKIPATKEIFDKIEAKLKTYQINVRGDTIITSTKQSNKQINIMLLNEHYSVEKIEKKSLTPLIRYTERKPIMLNKYKFEAYDGKTKWNTTKQEINKIRYDTNSEYIIIETEKKTKYNRNLTIEEEFSQWVKTADTLKEETRGLINMYKTGSYHDTALDLFDKFTKAFNPEPLLQDEAEWVDKSSFSALIEMDEEYTGPCYKYDIKSAYPYLMSLSTLKFPVKRGEFKILTELPEFPQFGIYRCVIKKGSDQKLNMLFKCNYDNFYTSTDLQNAKKFGYSIELIQDDKPNFLYYPRECLTTYNEAFKNYIELLFPLKDKPREDKFITNNIKLIINRLWGTLAEVDKSKQYISESFKMDEDEDIIEIYPDKNDDEHHIIKTTKMNNYYKTNWARVAPFLISKCREYIGGFMMPYKDHIKRIQTDGFISDILIHENINVKIGELRYEGYNLNGIITNKNNNVEVKYNWD